MIGQPVTIVIPCHNDGKYLLEALESAKAQTCPSVEVIIVDDHSTDSFTCSLLRKLAEQGNAVLSVPDGKRGPSAARNVGIAAASGEYILPLDADDSIEPTYAEKALKHMQSNPSIGICYCKACLFGLKHGAWKLPIYSWEEILASNMIFPTAMFRKKDWETLGGYDESLRIGLEDYAFWLRLIALGREVVQIDEYLFRYRVKQRSRTAVIAMKKEEMQAVEDVFRSCEPILSQNALLLFKHVHRLRQEKGELTCLLSWKFFRYVFALEWKARQLIKRFTGRA